MTLKNPTYRCPHGNGRNRCACFDCVTWRYDELRAGTSVEEIEAEPEQEGL